MSADRDALSATPSVAPSPHPEGRERERETTLDEGVRRLLERVEGMYAEAQEAVGSYLTGSSARAWEQGYSEASRDILGDLRALATLREAAPAAQPERCDCGAALTLCRDCAVADYQAANLDCGKCIMRLPPNRAPAAQTKGYQVMLRCLECGCTSTREGVHHAGCSRWESAFASRSLPTIPAAQTGAPSPGERERDEWRDQALRMERAWYGVTEMLERKADEVEKLEADLAALRSAPVATAPEDLGALRDAALECSDDLEMELRNRYGDPIHPAMQKKFDRDMATVLRVRALAGEAAPPPRHIHGG